MTAQWTTRQTWVAAAIGVVVIALLVLIFGREGNPKAIAKGFAHLAEADSFHTQTELVINLPTLLRGRERPFTKTTIRLEGDVARAEDRTPEFTGTFYLEARGRGNVFFADGQGRILRERVLFNLDNLPVFLNPTGSLVKRWTKVEAPLLTTANGEQVKEALEGIAAKASPAGKESIPLDGAQGKQGEQLARFTIALSEEDEAALANVFRQAASGNRALHVLARLLDANRVAELVVWTDGRQLRQIQAHFVRPLEDGSEFDFARLNLRFTDYGKEVAIDAPETKRFVRPDVFARIFGGGNVEEVKAEVEEQ